MIKLILNDVIFSNIENRLKGWKLNPSLLCCPRLTSFVKDFNTNDELPNYTINDNQLISISLLKIYSLFYPITLLQTL